MACVAPEGHCMGYQTDSNGKPGLPCELCQYGSPTDGTALRFVFECLLQPAYGFPPAHSL